MKEPKSISRRQLLGRSGAIGGGALLSEVGLSAVAKEAWAAAGASEQQSPMPQRVLGKTGAKVSILLQGGSMSWNTKWDPKIPEALKQGINYLDAAWVYAGGTNEQAIGSFLQRAKKTQRKDLWITSKSNLKDPEGYAKRLDESLARLKTSYVDMYYLHAVEDPSVISKEMLKKVEQLKKQNKMRHFGFSCHNGNVAELLQLAAKTPWVDSVMFRYNFRQYGNKELNLAMDAAHKAGVGLIAMKVQGSSVSFEDKWQKFQQTGRWNKFQAVMKAVWEDERITAVVSDMDSLEKIRSNAQAARDPGKLGALDLQQLRRYAAATRATACDGCSHLCEPAVDAPVPIATTLRYLMYHDSYGKRDAARQLYRALPESARQVDGVDFSGASAACPHGLNITEHLTRAAKVLV